MKKCLIISREFYPTSNGNIKCLDNILNELKKSYEVDLVCYKDLHDTSLSIDSSYGYTVYRIQSKADLPLRIREISLYRLFSNSANRNKIRDKIRPLFKSAYKLSERKGLLYQENWEKNSIEIIEKKVNVRNYDFILGVGAPFENIDVAYKLAEIYEKPLYILQLDLYADNPTIDIENKQIVDYRRKKEEEWYEKAMGIIVTDEAYKVVSPIYKNIPKSKFLSIKMPNLLEPKLVLNNDSKKINLLYAGMFYKNIRNPEKMLKHIENLIKKNEKFCLHIVGFGCEDILIDYQNKYPNNIFFYGKKGREFVEDIVGKSDILVNLSNKTTSQAPSKIIEYISTGKPIINFYSLKDDICKKILEEYPFKIDVDENDFHNDLEHAIYNALELPKVNFNFIEKKYKEYTPKYVVDKILTYYSL